MIAEVLWDACLNRTFKYVLIPFSFLMKRIIFATQNSSIITPFGFCFLEFGFYNVRGMAQSINAFLKASNSVI